MFKFYSKFCEYALRILTHIPKGDFDRKFTALDLCRKAKVPMHSARKALQLLVEHEYLEAVSGPGGGYKFRKNPETITLLDIIQSIDGQDVFEQCVMGFPQCDFSKPCPIHHLWQRVKVGMKNELRNKALSQLTKAAKVRLA